MLQWLWELFAGNSGRPHSLQEIDRLSKNAPADVARLARDGQKVRAIYVYRKQTGANLREAVAVIQVLAVSLSGRNVD